VAVKYIAMDLKYMDEWKGLKWVQMAQDIVKLGAFTNTAMKLLFPKKKSERISGKTEENFVF